LLTDEKAARTHGEWVEKTHYIDRARLSTPETHDTQASIQKMTINVNSISENKVSKTGNQATKQRKGSRHGLDSIPLELVYVDTLNT